LVLLDEVLRVVSCGGSGLCAEFAEQGVFGVVTGYAVLRDGIAFVVDVEDV
jgi:hypothetical protein